MTEFSRRLASNTYRSNIVIKITGVNEPTGLYFSSQRVDNGLTMDENKIGILTKANITGETVDFKDSKTSIPSLSFSLMDKDKVISSLVSIDETAWCGYQVDVYLGFVTSGFGWGFYEKIGTFFISGWTKADNEYNFKCKAPTGLLIKRIYTTLSQVAVDATDIQNTLVLENATDFPSSGMVRVNDEYISYSGKSTNTLTGCTRAQLSSEASAHSIGDFAYVVTTVTGESMDIALDIIQNQVGIAAAQIDTTAFTTLRDTTFAGEGDFTFYVHDVESALTWLEENILAATNTRLINKNDKISITILDQVTFSVDADIINDDTIVGQPGYGIESDDIVNEVQISYDYIPGTNKYATTYVLQDADSITNFGAKEPLKLEFKGVTTAEGGASLVSNRAQRILNRLSTPRGEISVQTFFKNNIINVSDGILLETSKLPQPGSGLDFSSMLEVLSKSLKNIIDNPSVDLKLVFTSYANIRAGLISPSPLIASVVSQKVFTVPDGSLFEVGYKLKLWNDATGAFYADAVNEIDSINGNQLTMVDDFTTTLTTSIRVTFPDYNDSSEDQRAKYAYICDGTGLFFDLLKCFQVIL